MKTKIWPIVYPNSLRKHRKAAGLRQLDVARLIGLEGSTERISKWENGAADPNIENLFRLLMLYKVSPQELYPEMWQAIERGDDPLPEKVECPVPPADISCRCGSHTPLTSAGYESLARPHQVP
jgi:transcriptional regulator with XRE-family HTH domain